MNNSKKEVGTLKKIIGTAGVVVVAAAQLGSLTACGKTTNTNTNPNPQDNKQEESKDPNPQDNK